MIKKRTRRILALVILLSLVSGLEPLQKILLAAPCFVSLLIEWDDNEFSCSRHSYGGN